MAKRTKKRTDPAKLVQEAVDRWVENIGRYRNALNDASHYSISLADVASEAFQVMVNNEDYAGNIDLSDEHAERLQQQISEHLDDTGRELSSKLEDVTTGRECVALDAGFMLGFALGQKIAGGR